jgi:ABC-type glutathione transport system ATPase component
VALLEVKNLSISFQGKKVVDSVSFSVDRGEVLGIVGESGSGKTLTALSILHLTPPGANVEGEINI